MKFKNYNKLNIFLKIKYIPENVYFYRENTNIKARYHLWLNVIITLSRCLFKIGATNHALLAKNSDRRSEKGPMSKGDTLFLSLSFSSCTYNAYPFPVFVLWSPTRYYVSREWQFERSHSRAVIFREQRQYLRRFHFFSISISSLALIRSHCSRFVHPTPSPSLSGSSSSS